MIKRVVAFGFVVVALMATIKDGRVLREAGLTGSCSVVVTRLDGSQLEACHPGKLEGRPDLTRQGCRDAGLAGRVQYWSCPAAVQSTR